MPAPPPDPGLCAACAHGRVVPAARSSFWRCELAETDPRFPRYPRLPVLACAGFTPEPTSESPPGP
ncbi:MAG TPA: hypothetical protein VG245_11470 [Candidatus Dormibacteraeota bacterium]|jgi:hypothetical protein|nr:hypothetical protein [Candidatus Dormibacteraeota bacterium]